MVDLSLDKIKQAFINNHPDVKCEASALNLWKETYKGKFENANDEAWHWTAFGMAFLNFEGNHLA
jgi:hypothetical protein